MTKKSMGALWMLAAGFLFGCIIIASGVLSSKLAPKHKGIKPIRKRIA